MTNVNLTQAQIEVLRGGQPSVRQSQVTAEIMCSEDWKTVYKAEMKKWQLLLESAVPLEMGTAFDEVSSATLTRFYEEKIEKGETLSSNEQEILCNRRLFVGVMADAGFSNYHEEWWHFDYGNQFDAKRTGRPAIYGAGTFTPECEAYETMRREHLAGTETLRKVPATYKASKLGVSPLVNFVSVVASDVGDLTRTRSSVGRRLTVSGSAFTP